MNNAAFVSWMEITRTTVARDRGAHGRENQFFVRAFVAMQYFGYLRRDPDTIGYANWVTTLTRDPATSAT